MIPEGKTFEPTATQVHTVNGVARRVVEGWVHPGPKDPYSEPYKATLPIDTLKAHLNQQLAKLQAKFPDADDSYSYGEGQINQLRSVLDKLEEFEPQKDMIMISERDLANLLALIHRDGGHYVANHGWKRAIRDAELAVSADRKRLGLIA